MGFFNMIKTNLILILGGLLSAAYIALKVLTARNERLEQKVHHYEVKEEADEYRAQPVLHDKPAILDRM